MKSFCKNCKNISICLILTMLFTYTVFAENKVENNSSVDDGVDAEINIEQSEDADEIVDKLETLLDPDNNELEEEVSKTLEKYSEHWLVKFFKKIIDAISRFLEAVLKLASEAAKIGVD